MSSKCAGLLDLPATALAVVASCLGTSDRKNLALTCSIMPAIIRPLCISLQVDLAREYAPPKALMHFSGIQTIVVVDSSKPLPVLASSTEPAFHQEDCEEPHGCEEQETIEEYSEKTLVYLRSVIGTILTAAATVENQGKQRQLALRMAVPFKNTGTALQEFIQKISPKQGASQLNFAAPSMLQSLSVSGGSKARQLASGSCPFTSVDAGWFIPDGCLGDLINKGTVSWCNNDNPDEFRLDSYTALQTLRLCVYTSYDSDFEDYMDQEDLLEIAFATIIPKITSLPKLKELHLRHIDEGLCIDEMAFPSLRLPHLTRLVIGKGHYLREFGQLTHFSSLEHLEVSLDEERDSDEFLLCELEPLSSLRDLKVSNMQLLGYQKIHTLTGLTSLSLRGLHEYDCWPDHSSCLGSVILPEAPMPMIRELYLDYSVGKVMEDEENFYFSHYAMYWILENGAITFPSIETMRLGVVEFPGSIDNRAFTFGMAADLMDGRVRHLLSNAPNLKYLSIDQARQQMYVIAMLEEALDEIEDDEGEDRKTGDVILRDDVPTRIGDLWSGQWQREVKFECYSVSSSEDAMVAHFEYTRK